MWFIYKAAKHLTWGAIEIYTDNMKLSRECNGSMQKALVYTQEGAAELAIINDLIDKMKITVKIKYVSINKKKVRTFEENPRVNLILVS